MEEEHNREASESHEFYGKGLLEQIRESASKCTYTPLIEDSLKSVIEDLSKSWAPGELADSKEVSDYLSSYHEKYSKAEDIAQEEDMFTRDKVEEMRKLEMDEEVISDMINSSQGKSAEEYFDLPMGGKITTGDQPPTNPSPGDLWTESGVWKTAVRNKHGNMEILPLADDYVNP